MADQPDDSDRLLSCEICLREIPASESASAEGVEYVLYFCGIECYDRWHRQGGETEEQG